MSLGLSRRDLLKLLTVAAAAGLDPRRLEAADGPERLLEFEALGNVTLLHLTDPHATLRPLYYREPDTLIGIGREHGKPPFLTGAEFLRAIRSIYEVIDERSAVVTKRFVEWPYRWTHRYEAEHLLERAGFAVEAVYGGYAREPSGPGRRCSSTAATRVRARRPPSGAAVRTWCGPPTRSASR